MRFTDVPRIIGFLFAAAGISFAADVVSSASSGMAYTMTNAASGNAVLAYLRGPAGQLVPAGSFATGGNGTAAELGSEGSVVLSADQRWLFAVNAGSNQVSTFAVSPSGLRRTSITGSGGTMPVSVTSAGSLVYVVNAGSDNIAGFSLTSAGTLAPIPGSVQPLSGVGVGPAQIAFAPEGDRLVVTEKNTNLIDTFEIGSHGAAMPVHTHGSSGMTPFGFAFARFKQLYVSEAFGGAANASALSSYRLHDDGSLQTIAGSLMNGQTASCWVVTAGGGRFAFVSNTGSNTLSSYLIEFDGQIALFQAQAASTGAAPADSALSNDGKLLYVVNGGDGTISGYQVEADGRLVSISTGVSGLPVGVAGLAVQ